MEHVSQPGRHHRARDLWVEPATRLVRGRPGDARQQRGIASTPHSW